MTRPPRLLAALLGTAATAASLVVSAPASSYAAASGTVTFAPSTGSDTTDITVTTAGACPDAATNVIVLVTGGSSSGAVTDGVIVGNTAIAAFNKTPTGGIVIPLTQTFHDFAQTNGFTPIDGVYTVTVRCRTAADPASLLDYAGDLDWTAGSGAFTGTYTVVPNAVATTTTLDVAPAAPVTQGGAVTLTATVSPAGAGSVQFKDDATNLGAPVAVTGGTAQLVTSSLTPATHSLTAAFIPTDADAYQPSTSAPVSYQVTYAAPAFLPTVYPAPRVGLPSTCIASLANATGVAYAWLKNGVVVAGATAATRTVPEVEYGAKLSCRVTATNPDNAPLVGTSPQATVGVGPALRATTLPYLYGTVKAGVRVYCKPGAWTPAATSYAYRWKLDGRTTSYTASSLVLPASWRGHYASCTVTAKRTRWTNGVATSKATKVA